MKLRSTLESAIEALTKEVGLDRKRVCEWIKIDNTCFFAFFVYHFSNPKNMKVEFFVEHIITDRNLSDYILFGKIKQVVVAKIVFAEEVRSKLEALSTITTLSVLRHKEAVAAHLQSLRSALTSIRDNPMLRVNSDSYTWIKIQIKISPTHL